MNRIKAATLVLAVGWSLTASASPWWGGITGNDTGGIIPWSPENQRAAPDWAAEHCARYGKFAQITSNIHQYGYYIAFDCDWRPPNRYHTHRRD